ncbi:excalibur calcium-binding domain-containing protein [Brevundimonas bacteroides]|uniref:excalibur calcium-binding domain-containing protein n=1 Tax=Brevundimonas bacteroides TaxID=74311 RepID=UPI0012EE2711|nr:excalibur calcium-binding domain-containing protein [Brevundimonas bacteroides]
MTYAGVALATLFLSLEAAPAHPGGLNSEGCHTQRRTGDDHCHRGGTGATRSAPPRVQGLVGGPSGGGAYANCTAARAAGAAPVRRGQPGYGPHLDRDGDGVGCE